MKRLWIGLACGVALAGIAVGVWLAFGRTAEVDASTSEGTPPTITPTTSTDKPMSEEDSLTATVVEAGEGWLLVEADAGSVIAGQVRVLTEQAAAFSAGDRVAIWHTGQMMPSLPPQLVATAVEKIG